VAGEDGAVIGIARGHLGDDAPKMLILNFFLEILIILTVVSSEALW